MDEKPQTKRNAFSKTDNDDVSFSNEMIEGIKDRLNSPLLFTYAVVLIVYNWQVSLYLYRSTDSTQIMIDTIKNGSLSNSWPLLVPLLISVGIHTLYPFVQQVFIQWNEFTRSLAQTLLSVLESFLANTKARAAEQKRRAFLAEKKATLERLEAEAKELDIDIINLQKEIAQKEADKKNFREKILDIDAHDKDSTSSTVIDGTVLGIIKPPLTADEYSLVQLMLQHIHVSQFDVAREIIELRFRSRSRQIFVNGSFNDVLEQLDEKTANRIATKIKRVTETSDRAVEIEPNYPFQTYETLIKENTLTNSAASSLADIIVRESLSEDKKLKLLSLLQKTQLFLSENTHDHLTRLRNTIRP